MGQIVVAEIVGEPNKVGAPRRAVDCEAFDLDQAIFEEFRVRKLEFSPLEREIVIAADADYV